MVVRVRDPGEAGVDQLPHTRQDVASVPTAFDETVLGFSPGDTVHFRAVARTDFVTINGPEATFVVERTVESLARKIGKDTAEVLRISFVAPFSEPRAAKSG